MTVYDPSTAPRQRDAGYKGDAWVATMPPTDGSRQVVALDTGLDSVTIVRVPDERWDRGPGPGAVHVHNEHDETIVLPTGSGWLIHGPDLAHLAVTAFHGPVVLALPARTWHHVVMAPRSTATGTCLFTATGAIVNAQEERSPSDALGRVSVRELSVASPEQVVAGSWSGQLRQAGETGRINPHAEAGGTSEARLIPYEQPHDGSVTAFDTGHDSVSVSVNRSASADRAPDVIDVRRHRDVDEFAVLEAGAGYIVNGPDLEALVRTPFEAPAVLVMPAGGYHAVVRTDDLTVDSILVHTDRRAVVPRYEQILERTLAADVAGDALEGADR